MDESPEQQSPKSAAFYRAINSVTGSMVAAGLGSFIHTAMIAGVTAAKIAATGTLAPVIISLGTLFLASHAAAAKRDRAAADAAKRDIERLFDNDKKILEILEGLATDPERVPLTFGDQQQFTQRLRRHLDKRFRTIEDQLDVALIYLPEIDRNTYQTLKEVRGLREDLLGDPRQVTPRPLHQLRPPTADFTGRTAEIDELLGHLNNKEQSGVVIGGMSGLGGIGKTELALVLADRIKDRYADAQFLIDLRGAHEQTPLTPAEALQRVIRGYHPDAKLPDELDQLTSLYHSVLNSQRALLVMDNARDVDQVTPLIPPAGCCLLVTSRQHFHVPGCFSKHLDQLPPDEARDLLLKIAPRIGDHADQIAELCGCLPLALTIAGSAFQQRPNLTATAYVERLTEQRDATLSAVDASIALSDQLLADELRNQWYALAVFPAGFDAAAAAAVWELEVADAEEALGALLEYSLIEFDAVDQRYHLHDLVRDYVRTRLDADRLQAASLRHAEHYRGVAALADQNYLKGDDNVVAGLALFDREWPNIAAAFAWARDHLDTSTAAARLCHKLPDAGAYCLPLRQHPREQIIWLETALAVARRAGNRAAEGAALGNLGNAHAALGNARRAIEYCEQQLVIAREIGDRRGEGNALGNLGAAHANLGDARRAT